MSDARPDTELTATLVPVGVMLAVMWVLEIVDTLAGHRLDQYGIRPRRLDGVDGVAWAPFLHGGFSHLIANSVPFAILGTAISIGAIKRFALVTLIVAVVGGVGTWLTGPDNTVHIGASGLVFGYLTYLLTRGLFARNALYISAASSCSWCTAECCGACCRRPASRGRGTCSGRSAGCSPPGRCTLTASTPAHGAAR